MLGEEPLDSVASEFMSEVLECASQARISPCCWRLTQPARTSSRNCTWYVIMDLKITPSGQTIVKPTALGPGVNTDTKLLIYGLFQKGRVLAQDAVKPLRVTPAEPGVYL